MMHALSVTELLAAWERALAQHPLERALSLLAAASPDESRDALAALSIGERDARLLTLREWTFGSAVSATAACPACGEAVELNFQTPDIRAQRVPEQDLVVEFAGERLRFRLPDSNDLLAAAREHSPDTAKARLVERCAGQAADSLPAALVDALSMRMAAADPQADVQLLLTCPRCGHTWAAPLDILSFFWTEIGAWAKRVLHEVHMLASAYGWSEREVLSLSPLRRQIYLDMVGA